MRPKRHGKRRFVCKAWRGLRDNPRMWASLEVEPYYRYRASGGGFDTNGLLRLVGWLRDVATVKTFSARRAHVARAR